MRVLEAMATWAGGERGDNVNAGVVAAAGGGNGAAASKQGGGIDRTVLSLAASREMRLSLPPGCLPLSNLRSRGRLVSGMAEAHRVGCVQCGAHVPGWAQGKGKEAAHSAPQPEAGTEQDSLGWSRADTRLQSGEAAGMVMLTRVQGLDSCGQPWARTSSRRSA